MSEEKLGASASEDSADVGGNNIHDPRTRTRRALNDIHEMAERGILMSPEIVSIRSSLTTLDEEVRVVIDIELQNETREARVSYVLPKRRVLILGTSTSKKSGEPRVLWEWRYHDDGPIDFQIRESVWAIILDDDK